MAYASRAALSDWLRIKNGDEALALDLVLNAASAQVDQYCGQSFTDAADTATARTFQAAHRDFVFVDPISSTTDLVVKTDTSGDGTFDETWVAADYQVEPLGQRHAGMTDHPYYLVRALESRRFPVSREARVQVTARWGWTTVPPVIELATVMHAARLFSRRNSAAGVALEASFPTRTAMGLDRDVAALLQPFRRIEKFAV